jgi:ABC-2 type transport system ATP-binding protein
MDVGATAVIEIRNLTKHYGETVGIEDLDLVVESGEVFGFLGPNGAGKTTTIRLLLDLIRPTRGDVRLFGRPAGEPAVRARVGYLPGELVLDGRLTGIETLRFLDALRPGTVRPAEEGRRRELCDRLGLVTGDLHRRVRDYSRGMKQKLGLVAALQHDPDLLVLDEPTTGLDPLVRESVFAILVESGHEGKTVFHSSHVLSEVDRTCTRAGIVGGGRLLDVMRVADVRRTSVRRMAVRFAGEVPLAELNLPGVELVQHDGRGVDLTVSGDLDPLIGVLARHSIEHLVFPEPSLEEAFVRLYRTDGKRAP